MSAFTRFALSPPALAQLPLNKASSANKTPRFVVRAQTDEAAPEAAPAPPVFCGGLAGSTAPFGQFDPSGALQGADDNKVKLFREAELTHGRVSMLAVLGFFVGENFNPLFGGSITGPAINHFQQVPPFFWTLTVFGIGLAEAYRLTIGWNNPTEPNAIPWTLKDSYTPGDLGFDPLGMKPSGEKEFIRVQNKELNNGRLAMIAIAGLVAQELVTGEKVF
ncbi:hypothetical protein CYMTET_42615 [Cymbomonas tetramitiformis]|uniref:Chlorophyll a-b binding protein, chloroplastic n=1 Tax=Cymbomonas tetramitiformis TaxID=36881 RepID=A0AAE0F2G7_9CHLO|nr:hypothetical protein CYMTET_42615 [Cymbomonas tetramitiformis]